MRRTIRFFLRCAKGGVPGFLPGLGLPVLRLPGLRPPGLLLPGAMLAIGASLSGVAWADGVPIDQGKPIRLLVLGDSLSAGYGLPHGDGFEAQLSAALHRAGTDVRIVDGAVSGDTSAGGLARLDWAIGDGADAAIVELGGNDGLRGVDPANTEANLGRILDRLQALHVPVLLCGMLAPPNLGPDYGHRFQAAYSQLATRPGILYDPFFLQDVVVQPSLQQADHIHPNAAGVAVIVRHLMPLVVKLLHERTPHGPQGPRGDASIGR